MAKYPLALLPVVTVSGGQVDGNIQLEAGDAATVERVEVPPSTTHDGAIENFTAANAPKMFPYAVGEVTTPVEEEAKAH